MAARSGTLTVKIVGDAAPFQKSLSGMKSKLKSFAATAAKAGAAAGVGMAALGKEVLDTGAQLETWRLKTKTVFEDNAEDIRQWADDNNEVFGVTDDELAGLAASFGDLLKPMGFTADEAADMSKDVVGLSGALSEWTGGQRSAAEVSQILSKAMLGERESLKELGISITEADVKARLAEKGQEDLTGAALKQAKALATQELLFEKSTDAQTAYAEGGNKALRSSNKLRAMFGELREQVADKLLPVVLQVTEWLGEKVPVALEAARDVADDLRKRWDEIFPQIEEVVEAVMPALKNIGAFIKDNLKPILIGLGAVIALLVSPFAAVAAGVVYAYTQFEGFRNAVDAVVRFISDEVAPRVARFASFVADEFGNLVDWVEEHWGSIEEAIGHVVEVIRVHIEVFVAVVTKIWEQFGDTIMSVLKGAWDSAVAIVEFAVDFIRGVIETAVALINGDWGDAWDAFVGIFADAWEMVKTLLGSALDVVKTAVADAFNLVKGTIEDALDAIVGWFSDLPDRLKEAAAGIWDWFFDAFNAVVEWLGDNIDRLLGPIDEIIGKLGQVKDFAVGGNFGDIEEAIRQSSPGRDFSGIFQGPEFHDGGVFRAPPGRREGLARLEDGERVVANGSGQNTINIYNPIPETATESIYRAARHFAAGAGT